MSSIFPREGLTLEAICWPLSQTLLQPLLTGPLLYCLLRCPSLLQQWCRMAGLGDRFTVGALGTLVVLGMLKHINDWLSKMAHNGYTKDLTWNWAREIVILTGGSSGIGAAIAAKLSESGSTIIILDINPPLQQLGITPAFLMSHSTQKLITTPTR